ncbi:hypothetical protein AAFF_G00226860 [Aldrovandia affinis]|uniref:Uncharacterized protein n=1 Tax=Aldrovandia affinis TaxID=143900 RepID=A0AAD7TCL7_9TELE|nr:hypothetical protein AAFF_G00226860 [Aldrovandia affinis]
MWNDIISVRPAEFCQTPLRSSQSFLLMSFCTVGRFAAHWQRGDLCTWNRRFRPLLQQYNSPRASVLSSDRPLLNMRGTGSPLAKLSRSWGGRRPPQGGDGSRDTGVRRDSRRSGATPAVARQGWNTARLPSFVSEQAGVGGERGATAWMGESLDL